MRHENRTRKDSMTYLFPYNNLDSLLLTNIQETSRTSCLVISLVIVLNTLGFLPESHLSSIASKRFSSGMITSLLS